MKLISNVQNTASGNITVHAARGDDPSRPVCGACINYDQGASDGDHLNCGRCVAILQRTGKLSAEATAEERRGDPR